MAGSTIKKNGITIKVYTLVLRNRDFLLSLLQNVEFGLQARLDIFENHSIFNYM